MRAIAIDVFIARLPSSREISFGTSFFTSFFFASSSCRATTTGRERGVEEKEARQDTAQHDATADAKIAHTTLGERGKRGGERRETERELDVDKSFAFKRRHSRATLSPCALHSPSWCASARATASPRPAPPCPGKGMGDGEAVYDRSSL